MKPPIKFAFSTVLACITLAGLGWLLVSGLSIRWQPGPPARFIRLDYSWPDASPSLLERSVTTPLEAGLALVRDIDEIKSVSSTGSGYINLKIDQQAVLDRLRFRVAAQVRRIYPELPNGVSYPRLSVQADTDESQQNPILIYSLSGDASAEELTQYAYQTLLGKLSGQDGIERIEISGGNKLHWQIALDADRCAVLGIRPAEVQNLLRNYFDRAGLGFLEQGDNRAYVYRQAISSELSDLQVSDWRQLPIPSPSERQLVLADVAEIKRVPLPATRYDRVNGQNSLRLFVYPRSDANRLQAAETFRAFIDEISRQTPLSYVLQMERDFTEYLSEELYKTQLRTGLSLVILLLFMLLAYRSWWQSLIIFIGLLVNLGLAIAAYRIFQVEINLYAFAGIAISFGIMIDNLIIVVDGLRHPNTSPVGPAVFGATLTSLAALSSILWLEENIRHQLFELSRVVAINLSTSLLVALIFIPALQSLFFKLPQVERFPESRHPRATASSRSSGMEAFPESRHPRATANKGMKNQPIYRKSIGRKIRIARFHTSTIGWLQGRRKWLFTFVILLFGTPIFWLPNRVDDWQLYNKTIGSDVYRDDIKPHVNRWLGGTFRLFSRYVYEKSQYREPEESKLYIYASLDDGATLNQMNAVMEQMESYLSTFPSGIESYLTNVSSSQRASIEVRFSESTTAGFPAFTKNRVTSYAVGFGGVDWDIYGVGQGFSNSSSGGIPSFRVRLRGYNQVGLQDAADDLAEILLKHPRVQEVNTDANLNYWERDRRIYELSWSPEQLAAYGASASALQDALLWFDQNEQPDFFLAGNEAVSIVTAHQSEYDRWRLNNWSLPLDSMAISFPAVASLSSRSAPLSLHKVDQEYLRMVEYEYMGSGRFGARHLKACLDTLRARLPLGFTVDRPDYYRDEQARSWTNAVLLSVSLIFFICALLFESLKQALHIILLVPVSFIGIFLTFYCFDVSFDQGGYCSFLLVTGLAVNGLIIITNEYNFIRKRRIHWSSAQCYGRAYARKIKPILLTILSTCAGLSPFLLGGKHDIFWPSLAAGTMGGLVFSVLVLSLVSPVLLARE
ncbi:MAG: efflux RND transporter permease subunit [Bacteroidota bacterium]